MSVVNDTNKDHVLSYEGLEDVVAKIKNTFVRNTKQASDLELGLIKALENTDVQLNELQGHDSEGNNYPVQIISDGTAFVNMPKPETVSTVDEKVKNEVITDDTQPYFLLGQSAQNTTSKAGTSENCYIKGDIIYSSDVIAGENVLSNKVDKEEGKGLTDIISVPTDESIDEIPSNTYLQFVTQSLTDEQKLQSRTNIGAICEDDIFDGEFIMANGIVSYDDKFYSLPDKATTDEYTLATKQDITSAVDTRVPMSSTPGNLTCADVQSLCGGGLIYALPDSGNGDEDDVLVAQSTINEINTQINSLTTNLNSRAKKCVISFSAVVINWLTSQSATNVKISTSFRTSITTESLSDINSSDLIIVTSGTSEHNLFIELRKTYYNASRGIFIFNGTVNNISNATSNSKLEYSDEYNVTLYIYSTTATIIFCPVEKNQFQYISRLIADGSTQTISSSMIYEGVQIFNSVTFSLNFSDNNGYTTLVSKTNYTIRFTIGSENPTITWQSPKTILWANGIVPTFTGGGKTYEVSFTHGPNNSILGVCGVFEAVETEPASVDEQPE